MKPYDAKAGEAPRPADSISLSPELFGPGARFHHVGMAVSDIEKAQPGAEIIINRTQGVAMAFVDWYGLRLEVLEPLDEDSPIFRGLREGQKLLHLCFEVPKIETALEHAKSFGFHRISRPAPTPEFDDRRIVWVFSKAFGLIELVEA